MTARGQRPRAAVVGAPRPAPPRDAEVSDAALVASLGLRGPAYLQALQTTSDAERIGVWLAILIFKAIQQVAVKDNNDNLYIGRKALRDAALAVEFEGLSGPIACGPYGECAQFKPAVYEFTSADPKSFKIGENPRKIWP